MPYELRLHCAPFKPTSIRGHERRVCIMAEHVIRDMESLGCFVVVKHVRSSHAIEEYLEDVQRELRRCPPPKTRRPT